MIRKVKLTTSKKRRVARVRDKLQSSALPRVSVFKSSRHFYAQLIDDAKMHTLAAVGPKDASSPGKLGEALAKKALKVKVRKVKFDRGGYRYHGKVKQFAEGLRKGGLKV